MRRHLPGRKRGREPRGNASACGCRLRRLQGSRLLAAAPKVLPLLHWDEGVVGQGEQPGWSVGFLLCNGWLFTAGLPFVCKTLSFSRFPRVSEAVWRQTSPGYWCCCLAVLAGQLIKPCGFAVLQMTDACNFNKHCLFF